MLLAVFQELFTWIMLLIILLNISQRKFPRTEKKRKATILLAVDFLVVYSIIAILSATALPMWLGWVCVAIGIIIPIVFRSQFWPFRMHCSKCGKRLDYNHIVGYDENLCQDCYFEMHPEEKRAEEEKKKTPEDKLEESFVNADKVDDINWDQWEPTERCVLTYVTHGDKILLINKKTGLGKGYINAPGGHIEIEETKTEAAIRETKEETGLDVSKLEERGTLYFQFKDGLRMIGYVFFTSTWSGTLIDECDETKPFWTDISALDYSSMWEDDRLWLPLALSGKKFSGYFIFDDLEMLDSKVVEEDDEEPVIVLDEDS